MEIKNEEGPPTVSSFLIKHWILLTAVTFVIGGAFTLGFYFGGAKFEKDKEINFEENQKLKSDTAKQNKRIEKLIKDSLNCVTTIKIIRAINAEEKGENKPENPLPKEKGKLTDKIIIKEKPTPIESIIDSNFIEIKHLKAENKELRKNLGLLQGEKAELKRNVQKYISKQDSLINELEILHDKIKISQGIALQEAEKEFATLLNKAKEERLKFDETQEGTELKKEVEANKQKQAEMEKQVIEKQKQLEEMTNELANFKSQNADENFNKANSTLKAAENMFNLFGINNKTKCVLIRQVNEAYDNAMKLGKECSKEKKDLKKKYTKCF